MPIATLQYPGINLNEEVANAWGFTGKGLGLNDNDSELLKHSDALCMLSPFAAPYIYDDMIGVQDPFKNSK